MNPDRPALHRRWLESFGFSAADWRRIKALADQVQADRYIPAALNDLTVPLRVGACPPDQIGRFSGRLLGCYRGKALLYWVMNEREEAEWRISQLNRMKGLPANVVGATA